MITQPAVPDHVEYLTMREAADRYHVSVMTLRRRIRTPSRRPLRIQAHQNPGSGPRCDLHPCAQLQLVGVMRALKLPPAHKVARAAIRVAALPSSCCCTYVARGELGEALKAYCT